MRSIAHPTAGRARPAARWIHPLADLLLVVGLVGAVLGVAYPINGATQAPATVKVPVTLLDPDHGGWGNIPVTVPGVDLTDAWMSAARPAGLDTGPAGLGTGSAGSLTLAAWGSTRAEQVLGRGDVLIAGLGLLVGCLALRPVLRSIAAGRPFERGTARRITVVAATVAVAGFLAPLLPQVAGLMVLDRLGLGDSPIFSSSLSLTVEPLLIAGLVLAVAVAFRAGEQLTQDVAGLV